MNNKAIRIPIIVIGLLLFVFKDTILSNQYMVIPAQYSITDWMIAAVSVIFVTIGAIGFRKKSTSQKITGLDDTVKHLEEEITELAKHDHEHKPIS